MGLIQKFKGGDVCRIRHWDDLVKEFSEKSGSIYKGYLCIFTEEMKCLCGRRFTIKDCCFDPIVNMYLYDSLEKVEKEDFSYSICQEVLEIDPTCHEIEAKNSNDVDNLLFGAGL